MRKNIKYFVVALALMVAGGRAARAGTIAIVLDEPDQTGAPGDTLSYFGDITNDSSDTIFLNSDSLNPGGTSADFTPNDFFLANVPISLAPGQSSGDIDLFDVTINDPFPDSLSTYSGTYSLLGGTDGSTLNVLDDPIDFSVALESGVPEPSAFALSAAGLFALGLWCRRKTESD